MLGHYKYHNTNHIRDIFLLLHRRIVPEVMGEERVEVLPMCPSPSPLFPQTARRCPSQAGGEGKERLGVLRLVMHCNGALGELVEEASLLVEETLHLSRSRNGLAVINALHAQLLHLHQATLDLVNLIISKCGPV